MLVISAQDVLFHVALIFLWEAGLGVKLPAWMACLGRSVLVEGVQLPRWMALSSGRSSYYSQTDCIS